MARPTPDELAKINETVNRMVQSDPLLQKYSSLISVATPRPNPCIAPTPRNAQRHAGFVETANKGDVDLLFEGDSITDWWVMNGPNAFKKYFGDIKVGNFAIAGDTTQGVLWGLQNGEAKGPDVKIKPKAIMLMIGTNNTGGNTAAEIAEGVGAIVLENRKDFPDAKILLLAVFPRGLPNDANRPKIADINKIISKLDDHQHVFYMDIGAKFLDPETKAFLPDSFRTDNLHPQEKGYDIWGAAVMPTLSAWLK
jgi:lysophospholipase L1-like esterase